MSVKPLRLSCLAVAVAAALACAPNTAEGTGTDTDTDAVAPIDAAAAAARQACLELQSAMGQEPCASIQARQGLLGCDDGATDPGCLEYRRVAQSCRRRVTDFSETYGASDCEYKAGRSPAASQRASRRRRQRRRTPSDLGDLSVADAVCIHIYARVRSHPGVDDELLGYLWNSDHCRRHYSAIYEALPDWWQFRVRDAWRQWKDSSEQPAPWETSPDMDGRVKGALHSAMSKNCGVGPACTVLGRCGVLELPEDHAVHPRALTCVARSDEECAASVACTVEGRCHADERVPWCVPAHDHDCADASLCVGGGCVVQEREVAGWGVVPTCGVGTTPMTSGLDVLGFIANPTLVVPPVEVELVSETVSDALSRKVLGLSEAQVEDVRMCLEREAVALGPGRGELSYMLRVTPDEGTVPAFSPPAHRRTATTCVRIVSEDWEFPKVDENSFLSFRVRGIRSPLPGSE